MKEKQGKKRFSIAKTLIVLFILYLVGFYVYRLLTMKINNIFIEGNNILTDQQVIDISGLSEYPSFCLTFKHEIKENLLNNELIKDAKINKQLGRIVTIKIEENIPLFIYNNEVILSNNTKTVNDYILPIITNQYIEPEIISKLVNKYQNVNDEIRTMISEIKYDPNDIDKERFIFTMNDGNYVYITLYKITAINEYIKIQKTLENEKGILYLDSGNYFEIISE